MVLPNIPKSWDEVSYSLFKELRELDSIDFENNYIKSSNVISILLDVDDEYLDDFDIDEINVIFNSISFIYKQPSLKFKENIREFYFKPFDKISFGEFLDIDYYIANGVEDNIPKIASVLFRKQKINEWGNIEWEPYGQIDIDKRQNEFINEPITSIYGIVDAFITFKKDIMEIYSSIFKEEIFDEDDDSELTPEDLEEERKEKELAKFSWQLMIDKLTNGDVTKVDQVTDLPLIQVFNNLVLMKVKSNLK
jgi:hypothetical protein